MESQDPSDRLQAYLDGTLSAAEEQDLERRLKADPVLADWLVLLSTEEAILKEWASTAIVAQRTTDATDGWPGDNDLHGETGVVPDPEPPAPDGARRKLRRRLVLGGCIAAALAGAAFFVWWQFFSPPPAGPPTEPIAVLEDVYGEVLLHPNASEHFIAKSGQSLFPDEKIQTSAPFGLATVRFPDGTRLELSTDTTVQLVWEEDAVGKRIALQEGFLTAEVPKQATGEPLVLATPHAEISVVAARFNCLSTAQTATVEVDDGRIEMVRLSGGRPVIGEAPVKVDKGSYAVAGKEAEALASHPLKPLQVMEARKVLSDEPKKAPGDTAMSVQATSGPVLAIAYAPDGKSLASGSWDGSVRIWGSRLGDVIDCLRGQQAPVRCLAFFPNSKLLACGGDRVVKIWDLDRVQAQSLPGQQLEVNQLTISADGKWLATANVVRTDTSVVKLWEWPLGGEVGEFPPHSGTAPCVAFAPNSQQLATGFQDGRVTVWAVPSRKKLAGFQAHSGDVLAVQFSPKGDLLASAGQDRVAKLWRWKEGKVEQVFMGHAREVTTLAFARDGRLLATGANDGTARLWDTSTGQEVATFKHRGYAVTSVAFAADGKTLATAGWDKTVKLWDVPELPPAVAPMQ